MNSEEMTTGSVRASEQERRALAAKTRWNNSTGNGTATRRIIGSTPAQSFSSSSFRAGDGGSKFRSEWPELDIENWKWMEARRVDPATGTVARANNNQSCTPGARALTSLNPGPGAVVEGAQVARNAGQGFLRRNMALIAFLCFLGYALLSRLSNEGMGSHEL
jgi:ubiquitin-conjugating enzyme E2 J2